MTTRKVILWTLILPVLYTVLTFPQLAGHDMSEKAIWICFGFGMWAAGLLVAAILTVIFNVVFKKPKAEPWLYLSVQLIFPLTIAGYLISDRFEQARHRRDFGNVDDNHNLLDIRNPGLSPDRQHVRTAFVKLESTFPDPNGVILIRYKSYWRDTMIAERADTLHRVYFTYLKDKKVHYTKMMVLGDSAVIDSLELPAGPAEGYAGWHFAFRGGSLTHLEDVRQMLQDEPQWVQDTVISILQR